MDQYSHKTLIGALIRKIREERSLTQLELAARMNINQSNIAAYEAGKRMPSPDWIYRACEAMDIDILEFYERLYIAENRKIINNSN